jgi:hypothetical protein
MKIYEQIAICYFFKQKYQLAAMYYKKSLMLAYKVGDKFAELNYYEKLATTYMNIGDTEKMAKYHDRSFYS